MVQRKSMKNSVNVCVTHLGKKIKIRKINMALFVLIKNVISNKILLRLENITTRFTMLGKLKKYTVDISVSPRH